MSKTAPPLRHSGTTNTLTLPGVRPDITLPVQASQRSAVTNGTRLFVDGDGNSPWARRWRDLVALHVDDAGGSETLSEAQISLIKRIATLELELEQMDGRLSMGQVVDLDLYSRVAGHLRRMLDSLGLRRVKRETVPDFYKYVGGNGA